MSAVALAVDAVAPAHAAAPVPARVEALAVGECRKHDRVEA